MKRTIGTLVLFMLLLLTIVALNRLDAPTATTLGKSEGASSAVN